MPQLKTGLQWLVIALLIFMAGLDFRAHGDESTAFGQDTQSEAALTGILYDLKQTQDRQPTNVDANHYFHVVDEFLSKGWDEALLDRYYRVSKPLYTTQIFIPSINADTAPRAFGAEKTVKPSRWLIHYKGQVSPPEGGTYRFVGSSDDIIAVSVNGKTELVAPLNRSSKKELPLTNWESAEPLGMKAADGRFRNGDWVELKAGDVIDLDVVIGERPGGYFNAFLMVEKQGGQYERDAAGHPILPIFQVASYDTPVPKGAYSAPPFARGFPPWKSYQ